MYARVLRFDVGFGRPQLADQIVVASQETMGRSPGFRSVQLLADYLGGRYTLISYWDTDQQLYDFSYSDDATRLEEWIDSVMEKVPFVGTYSVYEPGARGA